MNRRDFMTLIGGGLCVASMPKMSLAKEPQVPDADLSRALYRDDVPEGQDPIYDVMPPNHVVMAYDIGRAAIPSTLGLVPRTSAALRYIDMGREPQRNLNKTILEVLNCTVASTEQVCVPHKDNEFDVCPIASVLHRTYIKIEDFRTNDMLVGTLICNPSTFERIANNPTMNDAINYEFADKPKGILGYLWGADILASSDMPHGEVLAVGQPDLTGVVAFRGDGHVAIGVLRPTAVAKAYI